MFYGYGVLKGLMVTFRNLVASYFLPADRGGLFTVEYPEKRLAQKERFRNFPFLVYDNQPENLRCVACDICAKECPPKCIYIVREFDKDGKPLKRPAIFNIDVTVCMNCGICEEACPFDAIFMDHDFEVANADRHDKLLFQKNDLLKSNEYFNQIRPTDAGTIDAKRKAVEEKKKAAEAAAAAKAALTKQTPPSTDKPADSK